MGYQHVNVANQLEDPASLFHTIQRMIALRKKHAAAQRVNIPAHYRTACLDLFTGKTQPLGETLNWKLIPIIGCRYRNEK